jgi:hypothetical protein
VSFTHLLDYYFGSSILGCLFAFFRSSAFAKRLELSSPKSYGATSFCRYSSVFGYRRLEHEHGLPPVRADTRKAALNIWRSGRYIENILNYRNY